MNYQNILLDMQDGILTVTINRPQNLNALNALTIQEIKQAIDHALFTSQIGGVIITGAGNKAFVAGADIKEFANFTQQEGKKLSETGHNVFADIENCTKPVIAAINGFALGGGCELAMACHIRIASENARFGQPEVTLGLIPGYGATQRLTRYIGKAKAMELLMSGEMITANEALELGLINYITKADELLTKAKTILHKIMKQSPMAIAAIIQTVNAYYQNDSDGFATERELFAKCFETTDFKEGTTAFIEKRKPIFNNY